MSASWHVGYLRHDCPEAGCGVVVVPRTAADQAYAEEVADKLADYVWNKRHEFHYTGTTAKPDEALAMALSFEGKPFVITDSGDNTTSGATGWNTFILRQALAALDEMQVQVINLEASHKRSGVHYELFVRLPPGLVQERLGAQLAALEEVTYVDI